MAMYSSTMPVAGDIADNLRKICQILTTGAVGPVTPVPYPDTNPSSGDEWGDSIGKICQILHVNGGL